MSKIDPKPNWISTQFGKGKRTSLAGCASWQLARPVQKGDFHLLLFSSFSLGALNYVVPNIFWHVLDVKNLMVYPIFHISTFLRVKICPLFLGQ
jgi:hypothetical protein